MEFLNIGPGELIVIVLLAIILFGPEDILKIMRTIGGYVRKLQQMWAQVSAGLKGEFDDDLIPEEIQETIRETRESVAEVQKTLSEVTATAKADLDETITAVSEIKTSVEADIEDTKATVTDIKAAMEADIGDAKASITEIETSLGDITSTVENSFGEIPKTVETFIAMDATQTATDDLTTPATATIPTDEDR